MACLKTGCKTNLVESHAVVSVRPEEADVEMVWSRSRMLSALAVHQDQLRPMNPTTAVIYNKVRKMAQLDTLFSITAAVLTCSSCPRVSLKYQKLRLSEAAQELEPWLFAAESADVLRIQLRAASHVHAQRRTTTQAAT